MIETINKLVIQMKYSWDWERTNSRRIGKHLEMPIDKIEKLWNSQEPVSLETPIGDEDDTKLGDLYKILTIISWHAINTNLKAIKNIIFSYC